MPLQEDMYGLLLDLPFFLIHVIKFLVFFQNLPTLKKILPSNPANRGICKCDTTPREGLIYQLL